MLLENFAYPQDVRVRDEAATLADAGYCVTVVAPQQGPQPRRDLFGGVHIDRYPLTPSSGSLAGLLGEYSRAHVHLYRHGLRDLLRGADVLHVHNPPDMLFPVMKAARAFGRHTVYDHHDSTPDLWNAKFATSGPDRMIRWTRAATMRAADLAIVTNEAQAEMLRAAGPVTPVVTVRNGPRAATCVSSSSPRPGALSDPRLVFVGSLAEQDGVLDLPELLHELRTRCGLPGTRLTIVGDGPVRKALERRSVEWGVSDAVVITGWLPHESVPALIREADICVDPAPCNVLNHNSTMVKIGEYLAAAKPIVAYGLHESRRTAEDAAMFADCGSPARFAALVAELAGSETKRRDLARRAHARAPALVWEHSAVRLLEAYARLAPPVRTG